LSEDGNLQIIYSCIGKIIVGEIQFAINKLLSLNKLKEQKFDMKA